MKNLFNENAVREAAYYIWKNNGCPANTCSQDWNAALNQLSAMASLNNVKSSTPKASASKSINSAAKIATVKSSASISKLSAVKTSNSAKRVAKSAK